MIYLIAIVLLIVIISSINEFKRISKYNSFLLRKNNALLVLLRNKDIISRDDMKFIDEIIKNEDKPITSYFKNPLEPFSKF